MYFASSFDVEMDGVAIAPPKPIAARALDRQVRQHHVTDHTTVKIHESNAPVRRPDHAIVDGDISDGIHISITELDCAGGGGVVMKLHDTVWLCVMEDYNSLTNV